MNVSSPTSTSKSLQRSIASGTGIGPDQAAKPSRPTISASCRRSPAARACAERALERLLAAGELARPKAAHEADEEPAATEGAMHAAVRVRRRLEARQRSLDELEIALPAAARIAAEPERGALDLRRERDDLVAAVRCGDRLRQHLLREGELAGLRQHEAELGHQLEPTWIVLGEQRRRPLEQAARGVQVAAAERAPPGARERLEGARGERLLLGAARLELEPAARAPARGGGRGSRRAPARSRARISTQSAKRS